jgi:hypothetical protein
MTSGAAPGIASNTPGCLLATVTSLVGVECREADVDSIRLPNWGYSLAQGPHRPANDTAQGGKE